jgi:hypothetical protein
MRKLNEHITIGDAANHQLDIEVLDQPGSGGANHLYRIARFDTKTNPSADGVSVAEIEILFQNGPIKEVGVNGVTHETLLAILIDRMRGFQVGPFANRDNAVALTKLEEALMWLQRRTRERIQRGHVHYGRNISGA